MARNCPEDMDRLGGGRMSRREFGVKECYICRSTDHIQAKCPEAVCYRYAYYVITAIYANRECFLNQYNIATAFQILYTSFS